MEEKDEEKTRKTKKKRRTGCFDRKKEMRRQYLPSFSSRIEKEDFINQRRMALSNLLLPFVALDGRKRKDSQSNLFRIKCFIKQGSSLNFKVTSTIGKNEKTYFFNFSELNNRWVNSMDVLDSSSFSLGDIDRF